MANYYATVITFLTLLAACADPLQKGSKQIQDYYDSFEILQQKRQEDLVKSVALLRKMTNEYLDGNVSRAAWQSAWHESHRQWLETSFLYVEASTQNIDAWPITPGFLDSLKDHPMSGIINDVSVEISAETLLHQHQITDSAEVSLGFHAVEYYAFARPEADLKEANKKNERRRLFLRLVVEMLFLETYGLFNDTNIKNTSLLDMLLTRSRKMLSEFNRIGEHGQFSKSSLSNISVQLHSIKNIVEEPVALNNYLIDIDANLTRLFNKNLREAIKLTVNPDGFNEIDSSRLLLLLSALSHHLEDFVRLDEYRNASER